MIRTEILSKYILGLLAGEKGSDLLKKYRITETSFTGLDVIMALEEVMARDVDLKKLKTASNKLFNILYKTLSDIKKPEYPEGSFLDRLIQDNAGIKKQLKQTKQHIRQINNKIDSQTLALLMEDFQGIQPFTEHYIVMQNIVFPKIERQMEAHSCLKLMWVFHDDIVANIRLTLGELQNKEFDLARFNELSGKVFFNVSTIVFREENVLFPVMHELGKPGSDSALLAELKDFKLAFTDTGDIKSELGGLRFNTSDMTHQDIKLATGILSIEQLELIFENLPLDVTFVDHNDEVRYFSSPDHRIFPRTTSIIGRKVQNCHPHDSVHIVNRILEAFKKGEKSKASFWIKMGPRYVLIEYFALRDPDNAYRGVLEVSQEISDIQKIKGERRLLDW